MASLSSSGSRVRVPSQLTPPTDVEMLVRCASAASTDLTMLVVDTALVCRWSYGSALRDDGSDSAAQKERPLRDVLPDGAWERAPQLLASALGGASVSDTFTGPLGTAFDVTYSPIRNGGAVVGVLVTVRRSPPVELTADEVERIFAQAPIGTALLSLEGRLLKVNRALCEILGRSEPELLETTLDELIDLPTHLSSRSVQQMVTGERRPWEIETRYVRPDGTAVWLLVTAGAAHRDDGHPLFVTLHVQDISQRRMSQQRLLYLASHDALTGLWNRHRMREELQRAAEEASRYRRRPVLLLIDLDGFKAVNDAHGHDAGDAHLRSVARALRRAVRTGDQCARLGGDEFAVLLPHAHAGDAAAVARRIVALVADLGCTAASVGVAQWERDEDIESWVRRADQAMYSAKHRGGNGFARAEVAAAESA